MHPTRGVAGILGEVLGAVDVFELRPRIGLSSAAIADRFPADELVGNVVVTASYAIVGRWREEYDQQDYRRAMSLLEALGAAHLVDRRFGTLSEGERKRVQIARSLMTDPEVMLLDEPAAGLDLGGREDLVARLGALAADVEAPALVLVTHHVEEIPSGFTDVLLLRQGRVVAAGPLERTLTAENLSATFGLPLVVERHGDRWSARAASHTAVGDAAIGRQTAPVPVG
jgi:iron complex transport system ATP-binding protein